MRLPPLPVFASSSSTTSCGLIVICTTFGDSVWNRQSSRGTGMLMVFNLGGTLSNNRTYLLKVPCHLAYVRSVSVVSNWEMLAVVPILKCQGIMSVPSSSTNARGSWMQCINTGYSCIVPSLQSLHISSLSVYTLMLYGSIASTLTFRFFKYLSSILYGCLAPLVRSNVITTTGPLEVSGFAASVSVEGPIASVSA